MPTTSDPAVRPAWRTFGIASAAVARLGPARFGVGGGVNNALRQMGGAAGAALAVALVGSAGAGLLRFQWLYAVLAGLGLLTALLCLPVQTRPGAPAAAPAGTAPARVVP